MAPAGPRREGARARLGRTRQRARRRRRQCRRRVRGSGSDARRRGMPTRREQHAAAHTSHSGPNGLGRARARHCVDWRHGPRGSADARARGEPCRRAAPVGAATLDATRPAGPECACERRPRIKRRGGRVRRGAPAPRSDRAHGPPGRRAARSDREDRECRDLARAASAQRVAATRVCLRALPSAAEPAAPAFDPRRGG